MLALARLQVTKTFALRKMANCATSMLLLDIDLELSDGLKNSLLYFTGDTLSPRRPALNI